MSTSSSSVRDRSTATLCEWTGEDVSLEQVSAAASNLRAGDERAATRTSVVNLVVVADNQESLNRAGSAMRRLGARHPGRTILALTIPSSRPRLDAQVKLFQATAEGHSVWWEEISLVVSGPAASHLDSVVLPLILNHLPLVVWFPGELPAPGDQLASVADALLIDVRFAEPLGGSTRSVQAQLAAIRNLARMHTVTDLSWKRLSPWRELVAGCFEPPAMRPFLRGITSIVVSAQPGPRRLLAGWLTSRLELPNDCLKLEDAVHAGIEIEATSKDQRAVITTKRTQRNQSVISRVIVDGQQQFTLSQSLPEHGLTWSLAKALSDLRSDPVYEAALGAALKTTEER